jgi:hypothetical protein
MIAHMTFRLVYHAPKQPVSVEPYEDYNAKSALLDLIQSGASTTVVVGATELPMARGNFFDCVRSMLRIGESLVTLSEEGDDEDRDVLAELPTNARVYAWLVADYIMWLPVLFFASDGERVWIYTRTRSEDEGNPLIVGDRDREEPVIEPRDSVVAEIRFFLNRVFDDLIAAFPFLGTDELYVRYRQRIAALATGSTK